MHTRRNWIGYMAVIALMILGLACGGGARGGDATAAPATLAPTQAPAETSPPAPTPEPASLEIAVELGQPERNEDGGFAFRVIPGYDLASFGGMAHMLAPGADPDIGPVVSHMGWTNESENNNLDLYE